MGDPLTPNLPKGWKNWATSKEALLLGLAGVLVLNLYVCCQIGCSKRYSFKEKRCWFLLVWIYPVLGGLLALLVVFKSRQSERETKSESKRPQ